MSHVELARLGEVLERTRASEIPATALVATAVTLLALTGCRVGEIMGLHWSDVRGNRVRYGTARQGRGPFGWAKRRGRYSPRFHCGPACKRGSDSILMKLALTRG